MTKRIYTKPAMQKSEVTLQAIAAGTISKPPIPV